MRIKKISTTVFFLSFLTMFFIAGSLEQDYISLEQAAVASCVDFLVMGWSGFKSGMLSGKGGYKS